MGKVKMSGRGCVIFALCFFALVCGGSSCSSRNPNPNPSPSPSPSPSPTTNPNKKTTDPEIDDYDIHPTINGGIKVDENDPIPYQLRIEYINPGNGEWRHICGAVILDEKTAITAAHCFDRIGDRSRLQVVAGDFLLDVHETTEQVKKINKIIIHPKYTDFRHGSDIAILHVEKLHLYKYAKGVWLSHFPTQKLANLSAVISGWGMVSAGAPSSNSLQKGNVTILPPQDCLQRLTNRMKVPVREGIVCAHDPTTRTCSGDSGGPLVIQNYKVDGSFENFLVGITSFAAKNCSRQNSAGAFTEISHFHDWIQANRDPPLATSCSVAKDILLSPHSKKQTIYPRGRSLDVLCDFEVDNGGWTLIQKRTSGPKQEFNRSWTEYSNGFGSLDGNFWLGLENIHALTKNGDQELRIELEDFEGEKKWAKYSSFSVSGASDLYKLTLGGFSGDAGDSMTNANDGSGWNLNGMRFTTTDRDNDNAPSENCAVIRGGGGWWFSYCSYSNLNGLYFEKGETLNSNGMYWVYWKGYSSLAKSEMKIRPRKS